MPENSGPLSGSATSNDQPVSSGPPNATVSMGGAGSQNYIPYSGNPGTVVPSVPPNKQNIRMKEEVPLPVPLESGSSVFGAPVNAPGPATVPDTIVVTPASPIEPPNPYIPQGIGTPDQGVPPKPPKPRGNFFRRFLMILVFLLLIGGAFFGGRFILERVTGGKEVTISYWGLWENESIIAPIIQDFETQNPKIKVQYVKQSHRQYRERLQAAIDRDEGPDAFRFHNTWIAMLRNNIATVPETIMTPSEFSNTFYPVATTNLVAGQSIYGLPVEIDGLGLYYNEDLFAAAGVTPPTTWEEVLNIVPALTVKNDTTIITSAIALGTTGNVEHFSDIVATMMFQNGANLSEPSGPEAEETLIFYKKFADPSDPVYTWNDSLDNSIYAFAIGKVAMILAPSWRAFDIKQINPDLRFQIAPIPQLPGNTVTWASYWVEGVSNKSKNQEAAWKFIKYLTSKEGATKLYSEASKARLFGEPYARVDLASTIEEDPYAGAYIKQAPDAKSFPLASRTFDNGLNDKLIKYIEDALNGLSEGIAPTAALETVVAGFRQVFSSYGLVSASPPPAQ